MKDQSISLAGGCFWGMEALYRRLPGVTDVVCGYANGDSAAMPTTRMYAPASPASGRRCR